MKMRLAAVFIYLYCTIVTAMSPITLSLSSEPFYAGESFNIVYTFAGNTNDTPNFEDLQKSFVVLEQQRIQKVMAVNGQYQQYTQWQLSLLATKPGQYTIPSLAIGTHRTESKIINVIAPDDTAMPDVYIEATWDNPIAHLNSQRLLTVRLYHAVMLHAGQLSAPTLKSGQATILHLDQDRTFDKWHDHKRYKVTERRYAVFPAAMAPLAFEPIQFIGQMVKRSPQGRQRWVNKQLAAEIPNLKVNLPTAGILSTPLMTLEQSWSTASDETVEVGSPITRTLKLQADGVLPQHLPGLEPEYPATLKVYRDDEKIQKIETMNGITAEKTVQVAIMPTQAGEFTLPEIVIDWWDTNHQRKTQVKVPGYTIKVIPAVLPQVPASTDTIRQAPHTEYFWRKCALSLGMLWGITLLLLGGWYLKGKIKVNKVINAKKQRIEASHRRLKKQIKHAAMANDACAAKALLVRWARLRFNDYQVDTLRKILPYTKGKITHQLQILERACYLDPQAWEGKDLWATFSKEY